MKTISRSLLLAIALCACATLAAAPAHWFKWRSKIEASFACSQTPMGPGWVKAAGPFVDSHCTKLVTSK